MKRILLIFLACLSVLLLHAQDEIVSMQLRRTGLPDNNIRKLYLDSCGYVCMIGRYSAYLYDGYNYRMIPKEEALSHCVDTNRTKGDRPGDQFEDNQGNKVRILDNGDVEYTDKGNGEVITFNVVSPNIFHLTKDLKCNVITDIHGLIWVSTNGGGLDVFDRQTGTVRHISHDDPMPLIESDYIVDMIADNDGNIWVSAENYGVTCLNVRKRQYEIKNINSDNTGKGNWVRMLHRLDDGRILMADMDGRLLVSEDELRTIKRMNTGEDNFISACLDNFGKLWLGSRLTGIHVDDIQIENGRVDCIVKDGRGRMWACGLSNNVLQVTKDDGDQYSVHQFLADEPDLEARVLLIDHRGDIWLGAKKGLYVFNPDSLLTDSSRFHRMLDTKVMCLYESADRELWVGTADQGLFHASNKMQRASQFNQLTTKHGLASDMVRSISENRYDQICVGTEDGLSFFNPANPRIFNLFFSDSHMRNIFSERSAVRLKDGRMAFGSLDGIVITDSVVQQPLKHHSLLITDLEINGVSAYDLPISDRPFAERDISQCQSIKLSHNQNSLTFYFSNLDFVSQRQTSYQCMLEGYDRDWVNLRTQNSAVYKNLSPGNYTLRVRSTEVAGEQDNETRIGVSIQPPFWRTWWAYLIYLMLASAITVVVYRQVRHVARLRQTVAVEKQLTDYKLKFFTNISHEFRTPLTLIQGSMDRLKDLPEAVGQARKPIEAMQRNVDRMIRLVNQLLEFRRMQNNRLQLSLEQTDIVAFVYNICQSFRDAAEQNNISLSFFPSKKKHEIFIDRGFIDKAVYNLLSNALKYTQKGGSVTVYQKSDENHVMISVEDNGVGVPEDMRDKIFDRFARGQLRGDSLGIGLDLTAELMRTHHGSIEYQPREGGGSVFTITIPTDKNEYADDDFIKTDTQLGGTAAVEKMGFTGRMPELKMEPMNQHRVLIVEDDAELCAFMRQELGRYFRVETANDGEEALQMLTTLTSEDENDGIRLIISDVMMPRMGGFELVRRVRENKATRHIPIVLLTALNADEQQEKGFEVGADAYITKPFSLQLLLLQCRNLLQRSVVAADTALLITSASVPTDENTLRRQAEMASKVIVEERDHRLLRDVASWVDSHLADPELSVDKFAAEMNFGRTKFYAKLKELTGQTPNEFIRERRLLRAYELLSGDRINVAEVAYQVGMSTPQYLSTTFKKRFGLTPTEFQKGKKLKD